MHRLFATALAAAAITASGTLSAHHSTAMFNLQSQITLTGTVKAFEWTNPHIWIQVIAPGPDGKPAEWSIEGGSPNTLSRRGWKKTTFTFGDKVTAIVDLPGVAEAPRARSSWPTASTGSATGSAS